jgi:hypothetical protein
MNSYSSIIEKIMKILNYDIPEHMQTLHIIMSYSAFFEKYGNITKKQEWFLRDMLDIRETYFGHDLEADTITFYQREDLTHELHDFYLIIEKIKKNNFRKLATRNKHIRCAYMFIQRDPDEKYINNTLGRDF